MVRTFQDELAEEVTEQYSGDEPVHETNRKLPYGEIAPRPLNGVNSYIGNSSNLSTTTMLNCALAPLFDLVSRCPVPRF